MATTNGHNDPHVLDRLHERQPVDPAQGRSRRARRKHGHGDRHHVVPDASFFAYGQATTFGVGMIHGIGAETPTQVLLFLTAAGAGGGMAAVGLLVCFLVGLLTSNTLVALASTYGFLRASTNVGVYLGISVAIGASSLVLGSIFLSGNGGVLPAIFNS
jgi:high-affinity nickel-transport protein